MMNGSPTAPPKFKIGDLVRLKKSLQHNVLEIFGLEKSSGVGVIIGRRTYLSCRSHVTPVSGDRTFDYKILLSGNSVWVYEDEIVLVQDK